MPPYEALAVLAKAVHILIKWHDGSTAIQFVEWQNCVVQIEPECSTRELP